MQIAVLAIWSIGPASWKTCSPPSYIVSCSSSMLGRGLTDFDWGIEHRLSLLYLVYTIQLKFESLWKQRPSWGVDLLESEPLGELAPWGADLLLDTLKVEVGLPGICCRVNVANTTNALWGAKKFAVFHCRRTCQYIFRSFRYQKKKYVVILTEAHRTMQTEFTRM